MVITVRGRPVSLVALTVADGRITVLDGIIDRDRLARPEVPSPNQAQPWCARPRGQPFGSATVQASRLPARSTSLAAFSPASITSVMKSS